MQHKELFLALHSPVASQAPCFPLLCIANRLYTAILRTNRIDIDPWFLTCDLQPWQDGGNAEEVAEDIYGSIGQQPDQDGGDAGGRDDIYGGVGQPQGWNEEEEDDLYTDIVPGLGQVDGVSQIRILHSTCILVDEVSFLLFNSAPPHPQHRTHMPGHGVIGIARHVLPLSSQPALSPCLS